MDLFINNFKIYNKGISESKTNVSPFCLLISLLHYCPIKVG